MVDILDDGQLRFLMGALLSLPTKRSLQKQVGASDLSNGCDRCLAHKLSGVDRIPSPQAQKLWLQKEVGTGIHLLTEDRVNTVHEMMQSTIEAERNHVAHLAPLVSGLRSERHVDIAMILGYGLVGGTVDLDFEGQIGDVKSTDRLKLALLNAYLALQQAVATGIDPDEAELPAYWSRGKDTKAYKGGYILEVNSKSVAKLSYSQFHEEMRRIEYKVTAYFGQLSLYMLGREREGRPVDRASILWVNRDGNGYFDLPHLDGYEDMNKHHDVAIMTLGYDRDYALALVDRAQGLWDALQAGVPPHDLPPHELCFWCSSEAQGRLEAVDVSATLATAT